MPDESAADDRRQHPLSGGGDGRPALADRGLQAGRAPARRALQALRRETIAAAIELHLRRDRAQVPRASSRRSPTASTRPIVTSTPPGAKEPLGPYPRQSHGVGQRHDDRLHRNARRRRPARTIRARSPAPISPTRGSPAPLEPVNEGSFRALKAIVQEGNIMMAKFPGGDGRLEPSPLPSSVDTIFKALAPAMPDRIPGRPFRLHDARALLLRLRSAPRPQLRAANDRRRRLGRPADARRPSGSVSVCQGDVRNAPIESIELKCPVIVEARGCAGYRRPRQIPRRAWPAIAGARRSRRAAGVCRRTAATAIRRGVYGAASSAAAAPIGSRRRKTRSGSKRRSIACR